MSQKYEELVHYILYVEKNSLLKSVFDPFFNFVEAKTAVW
jgi:hypothetical protein